MAMRGTWFPDAQPCTVSPKIGQAKQLSLLQSDDNLFACL